MSEEIWKDIPEYTGYYQASSKGRIRSKHKTRSLYVGKRGYYCVGLSKNNKRKTWEVHRLIAMAFLNHTPDGYKKVVDHIDNNPLNNELSNLQVIDHRSNCIKVGRGKSRLVGATWVENKKRWRASIYHNGKSIYIGSYKTEKEAHKAYMNKLKTL